MYTVEGYEENRDFIYGDTSGNGGVFVKVVGFPGGESMWVELKDGTPFEGIGTIANNPICSALELGQRIFFANGDHDNKPEYTGTL